MIFFYLGCVNPDEELQIPLRLNICAGNVGFFIVKVTSHATLGAYLFVAMAITPCLPSSKVLQAYEVLFASYLQDDSRT